MQKVKSFFFSRILNKRIYSENMTRIGVIRDVIANAEEEMPTVVAALIRIGNKDIVIDWKFVDVCKATKGLKVICRKIVEYRSEQKTVFLAKDILDKQIVDINGKKVVRVNDIRLADINDSIRVIAVDIGFTGILRRLGLERFVRGFLKLFGKNLEDRMIIWSNVEPITYHSGVDQLKLNVSYKKLLTLHPADLADIIEELDAKYRSLIFQSLDNETAAHTLEEMEPEVQVNILKNLSEERASDILESMDADEAADILEELEEEHAEKILEKMEKEDSEEIRGLMKYEERTVGSIMTTEYISFYPELTVDLTIKNLRALKPSSDIAYYLYVVDKRHRLIGVVSLRDLIVAEPDVKIGDIMNRKVIFVRDTDSIDTLTEIVAKYDLLAIPVVDRNDVLVGMAIINDIVDEVLMPKWKRKRYA